MRKAIRFKKGYPSREKMLIRALGLVETSRQLAGFPLADMTSAEHRNYLFDFRRVTLRVMDFVNTSLDNRGLLFLGKSSRGQSRGSGMDTRLDGCS